MLEMQPINMKEHRQNNQATSRQLPPHLLKRMHCNTRNRRLATLQTILKHLSCSLILSRPLMSSQQVDCKCL